MLGQDPEKIIQYPIEHVYQEFPTAISMLRSIERECYRRDPNSYLGLAFTTARTDLMRRLVSQAKAEKERNR